MVPGVGLVISGLVKSGTIKVNCSLLLGPDKCKNFSLVVVKSIHVSRIMCNEAYAG